MPVPSAGDLSNLPPLVQVTVGLVVALVATLAYWSGGRGQPTPPPPSSNWQVAKEVCDLLQGIYRTLQESRTDNARFADENNQKLDQQTELLRDLRTPLNPPPRRR